MKIRIIFICAGVILCGMAFFMYNMLKQVPEAALDTVSVNDVVQTVRENWPAGFENAASKAHKYGFDIVILDDNDVLKFTSGEDLHETINEAIKYRDTIIDINKDGQVVGKVIIYNNENSRLQKERENLIFIAILFLLLLFALSGAYLLYLNKRVIKPFSKLRSFAASVAAGNLDVPVNMDRENVFGAFTESFDIMREELKRARENERKANESKKELVASLSHDIKTPVASIKAITELMLVKAKEEKQTHQLQAIVTKADQIELLINNLFNAAMEELSELKVQAKEEESTILHEMILSTDYNHRVKKVFIPECIIKCDKLRLRQVLDNVISNSYKYADTEIDIYCEIVEDYLAVHIIDNGNGVSKDELPLLFQKFYRGRNAEGKSGSGLGLYISKYFMDKMDGRLTVKNLPAGFEVTLYLYLP